MSNRTLTEEQRRDIVRYRMENARKMLEEVKSHRSNGFYNVTLNVWECNPGARAFYDSCNMKPLKTYLETIL